MSLAREELAPPATEQGRMRSLAPIIFFDGVGPAVAYFALRASGLSSVGALILSGVLPAVGIALTVGRRRRLDAIGALVLIGIVAGTALGLAGGSTHLVLIDGVVPTAVFGAACLGSLWSTRPMIFRFAVEFIGADTVKGRAFADKWRYPGFRHAFRVTTIVWGLAFLVEAGAQVAIIETNSAGIAKVSSNVLPLVVAAAVIAWNFSYSKRGQRQGELAEAAARYRGETPPPMPP